MTQRTSWRLKRLAISAFLVVHLSAIILWNLPRSVIRARTIDLTCRYIYPLGLWQNWAMFAPDPVRHTVMLEAVAVDKNGIMYNFAFPKMTDYSILGRAPRVRHSKFASYFASDEFAVNRQLAARHVVRQLDIPRESFPVEVELQYQVRETPPPGTRPDPMSPMILHPIRAYRFPTWEEVRS